MFTNPTIDIVGWVGAAALLLAYGLVSTRRVAGTARSYQFLNVVGSVLLMINTFYYRAYPSSFVNVIWLGIAAYALVQAGGRQHRPGEPDTGA